MSRGYFTPAMLEKDFKFAGLPAYTIPEGARAEQQKAGRPARGWAARRRQAWIRVSRLACLVHLLPLFLLTSCMFLGSTRSGSYLGKG